MLHSLPCSTMLFKTITLLALILPAVAYYEPCQFEAAAIVHGTSLTPDVPTPSPPPTTANTHCRRQL
jgi:hypothetical protein